MLFSLILINTIGYEIGQVKVIFSFTPNTAKFLFGNNEQSAPYFAYVEWFKMHDKKSNHLLHPVTRIFGPQGQRVASIIPLNAIQRSVQLYPQFGHATPKDWTSTTVLDLCNKFFLNSLSDKYAYYTMK